MLSFNETKYALKFVINYWSNQELIINDTNELKANIECKWNAMYRALSQQLI